MLIFLILKFLLEPQLFGPGLGQLLSKVEFFLMMYLMLFVHLLFQIHYFVDHVTLVFLENLSFFFDFRKALFEVLAIKLQFLKI